eukprot:688631-Amorphochlora_amoeboformis.AAC.1
MDIQHFSKKLHTYKKPYIHTIHIFRSSSFAKKGLQRTASHGLGRASEGRGVGSPSIGRTASHGLGRTTNRAVDRAGSQGIERGTKDAPV